MTLSEEWGYKVCLVDFLLDELTRTFLPRVMRLLKVWGSRCILEASWSHISNNKTTQINHRVRFEGRKSWNACYISDVGSQLVFTSENEVQVKVNIGVLSSGTIVHPAKVMSLWSLYYYFLRCTIFATLWGGSGKVCGSALDIAKFIVGCVIADVYKKAWCLSCQSEQCSPLAQKQRSE